MKFLFFVLISSCTTITNQSTTELLQNAPRCNGYPSKEQCGDGDMALFAGLLCAAEVSEGCHTVRDSQDWTGRFWRSPRRNAGNLGRHNSFSRDMTLGVLLYLATTKDIDAANKWINWIENNRPCIINIFGECKLRGFHRVCTDDDDFRCTITPTVWSHFHDVWKYLGLEPTSTMYLYADAPKMKPGEKGYQIHLYGVAEFLRQKIGKPKDKEVIQHLLSKEPNNPFFMYLAEGKTDRVIDRYKELCPKNYDHRKRQWAWERRSEEKAWEQSMIWDCIFMEAL